MQRADDGARPAARRDDALDRRLGARGSGPSSSRSLEELGRRAAVAVDNARLYRQRSAIARTLQNSLLPPVLPEIAGVETAALYRAAGEGTDVGGDFYDLFSVADDEWIAVIGDVCGKGAEAAAVTALARYTIRAAAVRRRSPAAILRWLNDAMRRQDLDGRFCTIACVHLDTSRPVDPRDGGVRRASAGAACGARTAAVEEVGVAGHAARARARPGARGRSAPSCAPATRSCSTRTASPRRARRSGCSSADELRAALAATPGRLARSGSSSSSRRWRWARRARRRATTSRSSPCAPATQFFGLPVALPSSLSGASASGRDRSRTADSPPSVASSGTTSAGSSSG